MVEEVRERVIRASSYRPFEAEKRVFVIEAAEQMRDESQNALLKTLEEPPDFVHLILLTAEPSMLLETIASRCQPIDFAPLPPEAIEAAAVRRRLSRKSSPPPPASPPATSAAPAFSSRLRQSFAQRPGAGRAVEARCAGHSARECVRRVPLDAFSLERLLKAAESVGEEAEATTRDLLDEEAEAGVKRSARDITDEAKRAGRRRRTETLDLALS